MRKFILFLTILFGLSLNSNAQSTYAERSMNLVNVGASYHYKGDKYLTKPSIDVAFRNVLLSVDLSLQNCNDKGDERHTNLSLGYAFPVAMSPVASNKTGIYIGPTIGLDIDQDYWTRQTFNYVGHPDKPDVNTYLTGDTKTKFDVGGFVCARVTKHINILFKASVKRAGISVGYIY